ncbi:hypothetical protein, partial [Mesorhizobium sp.]|uniref:hypothetical protein n=1 Tax=Mesorhizobium sp. TaxID=1871066 RepID=UPI0025C0D218
FPAIYVAAPLEPSDVQRNMIGLLTFAVAKMQRHLSASFAPGNDPSSGSLQPHFSTTFGTVKRQARLSPRTGRGVS